MADPVQTIQRENPPITTGLRAAMAVAVVVVLGGGLLLFVPDRATRWVWTIGPFNSRFLGAVYLAEMAGGLVLVIVARHFPARVVAPVALTFTGVVLLASLVSAGDFDFDRRGPGCGSLTAVLPFYVWRLGRGPQPAATPSAWRRWFSGEGVLLVLYGLGLLVAPNRSPSSGRGRSTRSTDGSTAPSSSPSASGLSYWPGGAPPSSSVPSASAGWSSELSPFSASSSPTGSSGRSTGAHPVPSSGSRASPSWRWWGSSCSGNKRGPVLAPA